MDQQKLRDYFEDKAEVVLEKIEQTPARKLIVTILVLVSFGVLTLGYLQIKTQLERPFLADQLIDDKAKIRGPVEFLDFYKREQRNRADLLELQQKDSDTDGLTDYQEIYIYRTNAFNKDGDSDGINDYDEVGKGTDPNCPTGQLCDEEGFIVPPATTTTTSESSDTAASPATGGTPSDLNLNAVLNSPAGASDQLKNFSAQDLGALKIYFENLSLSDFKQLLIQQKYPQDQLDKMTDADLQDMLDLIKKTF